jgi:hypothetical protein
VIRQESTWNKETGQLTSFTEYVDGRLLLKRYYDEHGSICRFERNGLSGDTKWVETNEDGWTLISYKDTLGGLIEKKQVNEGKLDVQIDVLVNVKTEFKSEFKSIIYDFDVIDNVDELIENKNEFYYEFTLKLFDEDDNRILYVKAVKEPKMVKFILYKYDEDISQHIKSSFDGNGYKITSSKHYKTTVDKSKFIKNAKLLHYLDEYNIVIPND